MRAKPVKLKWSWWSAESIQDIPITVRYQPHNLHHRAEKNLALLFAQLLLVMNWKIINRFVKIPHTVSWQKVALSPSLLSTKRSRNQSKAVIIFSNVC